MHVCAYICVCVTVLLEYLSECYQFILCTVASYKCDYNFQMGLPMEAKSSTTEVDHVTSHDTAGTQQTDVAMVTTDECGELQ